MPGIGIIKLQSLTSAGGAPLEFTIERQLSGGTGPLLLRRVPDGRQFVLKAEP